MTTNERHEEMAKAIAYAEEHEADEEERPYVRPQPPRVPAQVYSVRIPVDRIEELRQLAQVRCVQPTTLMRQWVLDRLDHERAPRRETTVVVRYEELPPQATLAQRMGALEAGIDEVLAGYERDRAPWQR